MASNESLVSMALFSSSILLGIKNLRMMICQHIMNVSPQSCIAKFLAKSYNKKEQIHALKENRQVLIHPRDTLFTLAAITGDKRYLGISAEKKEGTAVCEVADALVQMGYEQSLEELAKKDLAIAERDSAIARQKAKSERLLAEKDAQIAMLMEQLKHQ